VPKLCPARSLLSAGRHPAAACYAGLGPAGPLLSPACPRVVAPPSAPIPGASPNRRGRPRAGRPARRGLHRRLRAARKNAGNPPPCNVCVLVPGRGPGALRSRRRGAASMRARVGSVPGPPPQAAAILGCVHGPVPAAVPGWRPSPVRRLAGAGPGLRRPLPALQRLADPAPTRLSAAPGPRPCVAVV